MHVMLQLQDLMVERSLREKICQKGLHVMLQREISKYNQKIPQSNTADHGTARKGHRKLHA